MPELPLTTPRFNLDAIESTLKKVQAEFPEVNTELNAERDLFHDETLVNMMAGYAYVDAAVAAQIDLFASGHSGEILELNHIVLYGTDPQRRLRYLDPLKFNEQRFYNQKAGGIGELIEAYRMHNNSSVWKRAAMIYIHILSQPQLFLEGNHRTGVLLVSYLLVREGQPPFVLTADNAKAYFDPSAAIGKSRRHSVLMFFRRPRLIKHFTRLLKEQANPEYLL